MLEVRDIVGRLGLDLRVEQIVLKISGASKLTADLKDLCQMVYLILLEYPQDKLNDLWESDAINFLIVRLVLHNLRSKTSRYYYIIKMFSVRSTDLKTVEYKTEEQ